MKSAIALMPMAIIALVMTKAHSAATTTKRQAMMMIAGWAGEEMFRCSAHCSLQMDATPSLVALTPSGDLFDHAKDLFVSAKQGRRE